MQITAQLLADTFNVRLDDAQNLVDVIATDESPAHVLDGANDLIDAGAWAPGGDQHGAHGVEFLEATGDYYGTTGVAYVNRGDPYRVTLMFDYREGSYLIGCWGDLAETDERFCTE